MKIHSIISVIQFELKSSKTNSYNRLMNSESLSIAEADFEAFFYVLKRILDKRVARGQIYYLVKWKKYDNEHNVWYSLRALNDVKEFIAKYETRLNRWIFRNRRIRMPDRRKTLNETAFSIKKSVIEVESSQAVISTRRSRIEVRIS